jgi:hypothetical protein
VADGMLYLGTGDGGGAGDVPDNAQNTDVLLGKLLRLNVASLPYLRFQRAIRSSGRRARMRSGRMACGVRGVMRSTCRRTAQRQSCISAMSGRMRVRRWMS